MMSQAGRDWLRLSHVHDGLLSYGIEKTLCVQAMARDKIATNDRQLACALISSQEGQVWLHYSEL